MKKEQQETSLLCSVPLCKELWSVNTGTPKCSYHRWGSWPSQYSREPYEDERNMDNDPKWWAKKIIRDYEGGISRTPLQVKFAKEALRV